MVAGSVIRVMLLPGPHVFDLIVAAVLLPLGLWLALTRPARAGAADRPGPDHPAPGPDPAVRRGGLRRRDLRHRRRLDPGPVLIGTGRPPAEVAPAALASTFVTSVAGVITFTILSARHHGSVAPDWPTGIALGVGGLAGAYTGARIQSRLPDALIRRLVGILVVAIGARYLWAGLG